MATIQSIAGDDGTGHDTQYEVPSAVGRRVRIGVVFPDTSGYTTTPQALGLKQVDEIWVQQTEASKTVKTDVLSASGTTTITLTATAATTAIIDFVGS